MAMLLFFFVLFYTLVFPIYSAVVYPKMINRLRLGLVARPMLYYETALWLWLLSIIAVFLVYVEEQAMAAIGLTIPLTFMFWLWLLASVMVSIYWLFSVAAIAKNTNKLNRIKEKIRPLKEILPHNQQDMRAFIALSLTAGICEEILYRGFLIWYLSQFMSMSLAMIASVLLFAVAHSYQGKKGMLQTGFFGLILTLAYYYSGSLLVPVILHAVIDIQSGLIAKIIISENHFKN